MITFKAKMRNVGQTPRKMGEVAALIRRRSIDDALVILDHTPRRAASFFIKLLKNAQAAAQEQHRLNARSLHINEVFVVAGPSLVRYRRRLKVWRRYRRQMLPWRKRSSHVFLTVQGEVSAKASKTAKAKQERKTNGPKS